MEEEDTLASFLLRHPTLEELEVWPLEGVFPSAVVHIQIPLPHLRHLQSPAESVSSIVTKGLKEARLSWYFSAQETTNIEAIIVALKSMTRTDIPFVSRNENCNRQCTAVVDSISRNIPHTKTLGLHVSFPLKVRFYLFTSALALNSFVPRMIRLSISAIVLRDSQA
jgi:hypothetical protein